MRITNLLNFLGMNPKMKGYQYSRYAVDLLLGQNHPPEIESVYEQVAQNSAQIAAVWREIFVML